MPFVDLGRRPPELEEAVKNAVLRVLGHKQYILGPEVDAFEKAFSALLGGGHAVGVSSGTDALLLGLMTLDVRRGETVLTTPFSFFATAGVIARLGARPLFVDVVPGGVHLDTRRLQDVDPRTVRAVVPVHLFGDTMELDPLRAWAGDSVAVLEDAAQAIGAVDDRGRIAGTLGDAAAFSFFPTKNLGAPGDAGLVCFRDAALRDRAARLRNHGQEQRYLHAEVGGNFRLDATAAAALAASLPYLEELTRQRRRNAQGYQQRLAAAGLLGDRLAAPRIHAGHTCHQYVLRVSGGRRDAVLEHLRTKGIGAAVYYPVPFHLQPCFRELGHRAGDFPEAERAAAEVLALPIFPGLTQDEQDQVVAALKAALDQAPGR